MLFRIQLAKTKHYRYLYDYYYFFSVKICFVQRLCIIIFIQNLRNTFQTNGCKVHKTKKFQGNKSTKFFFFLAKKYNCDILYAKSETDNLKK